MNDHTIEGPIERDVTVYVERNGIYLAATYACRYTIINERIGNGDRRSRVEVEDRTLIKVEFGDVHDNEYRWIYGDDMHPKIRNAVDTFGPEIENKLNKELKP
jgi:hypothetical protein